MAAKAFIDKQNAERKAVLVLVRGRVQGVGFRYEARSVARSLTICGWVSNASDGGVETYAEGFSADVDAYIAWLKHGPPQAHVDYIDVSERKPSGTYTNFFID